MDQPAVSIPQTLPLITIGTLQYLTSNWVLQAPGMSLLRLTLRAGLAEAPVHAPERIALDLDLDFVRPCHFP